MVARLNGIQKVRGSTPLISTKRNLTRTTFVAVGFLFFYTEITIVLRTFLSVKPKLKHLWFDLVFFIIKKVKKILKKLYKSLDYSFSLCYTMIVLDESIKEFISKELLKCK